ncbi:MAG: MATE family efflux transporter [Gammaproteobacteria bacterium]|nr:MATE family efflux transporter [Gammaproteobacteria bacterium]MEE3144259.1 MATE family efflux transporter [Pseudomonadota bacterium]HAI15230.1 MATE family efflux transporter [Gammaproteobacteria bacterium]HBY00753.1 MATE family efflux transporter [Gammaproteobacteria bacterium]
MSLKDNNNTYNLVDGSIQRSLIRMTTPMIIGMLALFTFQLVDTWFISFLGTESLTAISFTFPVTFTVMSLAIGLGIGASAVVAKALGSSQFEKAKEAATVINYISLILACLVVIISWILMEDIFTLMGANDRLLIPIRDYMVVWLPGSVLVVCIMTSNSILRGYGDTKTPSILMAAAAFSNALLDPLFIFGIGPFPELGIQGAALATVISWMLGFCYLFYLLVFKMELVSRSLPNKTTLKNSGLDMLSIGVPAAGANMMTPLAAGIMTAIAAGFGDSTVAAFGVGARIEPIATLLVLAISSSLPPLISQNYGAGRLDRIKEAYRIATRFILVWQLIIYLLLAVGAGILASIFSEDPEVVEAIKLFVWIMPLGYGLQGIIILTNSSLNALHRPLNALILSIARFFVFYLPLAYVGSVYFGLYGFFAGAVCGNLLMAMISWRTFKRALSGEQQLLSETT